MDSYFDLNPQTYDWCARAFDRVRKLLGLKIKMHHEQGQIEQGDIFLFNHFARMETFIPQYLIYQHSGDYCRSIAAAQFFQGNDRFAQVLRDLGVVPNNHPHLMSLLATDILRGRKIVVFPEGGMVKDRQVIDAAGRYHVFSRHAGERRKHHTGAARLAIGLNIFKQSILEREARGDTASLAAWAEQTGIGNIDTLLTAARRSVTIVPANITFYPLRISDNILRRGAEMMSGGLSARAIEELTVEGNLLLKATDMDINLSDPMPAGSFFGWYEKPAASFLARRLEHLDEIFDIEFLRGSFLKRRATAISNHVIERVRDRYMREIYQAATVNLSHLASSIILRYLESGQRRIAGKEFRYALYFAVKHLQGDKSVRLHRGLCDPDKYQAVLSTEPSALADFLDSAASAGLLEHDENELRLLDKIAEEHEFDSIRLENPIEVYANEAEPLASVALAVKRAVEAAPAADAAALAHQRFDDELKSHAWDTMRYSQPKHSEINDRETATESSQPFLLVPDDARDIGVVLTHGFLASPAEMRGFGEVLRAAGYAVVGMRLKGHGTSPWDLRDRSWRDWCQSVEQGRKIMSGITSRVVLVGFSTGGSLSLVSAAEQPEKLDGVVAVCPPLKFRNRNMRFVPLMHGANKIVRWLSSYEGVMPFRVNESEHPHINYRNMPLRGLYELTRLVAHLNKLMREVKCPTCVVQSTGDQVVDPASASLMYDKVSAELKELHWIEAERHGILNEDIGETHQVILEFLARLEASHDHAG